MSNPSQTPPNTGTTKQTDQSPQKASPFVNLSNTELAVIRTDLASDRNRLAAERPLMAWICTSLSMISFGFGIVLFFIGLATFIPLLLENLKIVELISLNNQLIQNLASLTVFVIILTRGLIFYSA